VNVGDNAGTVQDILAPVNVENPLHFTTLNVDSGDPTGHTVTLSRFTPANDTPFGQIAGLAPAAISYRYVETSSVNITTGSGGDTINVQGTGVTTNLSCRADGTVNVGNGGSVQGILGALNVDDPSHSTTLNVDDSADTAARTVTLGTFTPSGDTPWGSITGLAPAAINYEQGDFTSPVTIEGGHGCNTFNVISLPSEIIALNTGGGNDKVNVQTTSGILVVNGQGGNNTLVGPNANETWHVTGTNAGSVGGSPSPTSRT
jgi:hypothetical protein